MTFDNAKNEYLQEKAPEHLREKIKDAVEKDNASPYLFFSTAAFRRNAALAAACLCFVIGAAIIFGSTSAPIHLTDKSATVEEMEFVPSAVSASIGTRTVSGTEAAQLPLEISEDCKVYFEAGRFAASNSTNPPAEISSGTKIPAGTVLYIIVDGSDSYSLTLTGESEYTVCAKADKNGKLRLSLTK